MIQKLQSILTPRDKQFLLFLLGFSIFISIIETIGISVIMPFITVATNFDLIHTNQYYTQIYHFFNFQNDVNFVISFGAFLICFYLARSIINILYFYLLNRFTHGRYHILAFRLFENYMGLPYKEFIKKNSSTLTKSIVSETQNLTSLISAILFMMSEVFIVVLLYCMMLYVNYKITFLLTIILFLNALFMLTTVSKIIKKAGVSRTELQKRFFETINRSFGNFKLIKLSNHDDRILKEFAQSSFGFAKANITNTTLSQVPKLFLEAVGFSIIVFIVTFLVYKYETNVNSVLGIISMFVLALYRLMPSVNRIMSSYNQIIFNYRSLEIIHNDLMYESEALGDESIRFTNKIELKNVSFEYETDKPILTEINLEIKKGSKIAFIGESGSGKSTLVDLIIGLYKPKLGVIKVDGTPLTDHNIKQWRAKIGYIPQNVYLFDGTVAENVAFGSYINPAQIIEALKQANIYDFLKSKNGIDTKVGEDGIMLSGGQKQRIAIARALYNKPEILILDEATSALDNENEESIMNEIYNNCNDKTLIIIAHRLTTIEKCDIRYCLANGTLTEVI